jgi:hypothetical protein
MTDLLSKKLTALAGLALLIILDQQGLLALSSEALEDITYAVIAYLLGQSVVDLGVYTTQAKADAAANAVLDRIANGELPVREEPEPDVEFYWDESPNFPKDPLEN